MEVVKKPETIISLINSVALMGASLYFYRRINGLEQELEKNTEHLASTIKKVGDLQLTKQHIKQLADAIKSLNNTMGGHRNEISQLRHLTNFQHEQIKELQGVVEKEDGKEIKLTQIPFSPVLQYQLSGRNQGSNYQNQYSGQYQETPGFVQNAQGMSPGMSPGMNQGFVQNTQGMNQNVQGMNQGFTQNAQGMNQGMGQRMNPGMNSRVNQGQGMNSGFNQNNPGMNQMNTGFNQNNSVMNPGMNQGFNQNAQGMNSGMGQGFNQNAQGMGQTMNFGQDNSLIDLGGLEFNQPQQDLSEEEQFEQQLASFRQAKQNSNVSMM